MSEGSESKVYCLNFVIFKLLILRDQTYDCLKHLHLTITVFNSRTGKHMSENLPISPKHKLGQLSLAFLIYSVS